MNKAVPPEFDRFADRYTDLHRTNVRASGEEPSYFSRYKARYMAAELGSEKATRPIDILDFGCGIGNSIPHLRAAFPNAHLHGVDPSGESIKLAGQAHPNNVAFRVNDGDRLPYDDGYFDLIQAACVFHHIRHKQRQHWMGEIHRILKPGGEVFLFEHNVLNPLTVKAVHECPFDEDVILLPRRESLDLVLGAGFTHARARYIVFFPAALAILRPLEPWLGFVPFGAQYVVRATA